MAVGFELKRTHLLFLLEQNPMPLIVMAAPNGFGKTVLSRQFIEHKKSIFLTCQFKHISPQVFFNDLFEILCGLTGLSVSEQSRTVQEFLEHLPDDLILVFDGVQDLSDGSLRIMREIAFGLNGGQKMIITTHRRTDLRWGVLSAQTMFLDNVDLKFTNDELSVIAKSLGVSFHPARLKPLDGYPLFCILALSSTNAWSVVGDLLEDFLYQIPPELLEILLPLSYMHTWTETMPTDFGINPTLNDDVGKQVNYIELCYKYRLPLFEISRGLYKPHTLLIEALFKEYLNRGVRQDDESIAIELYLRDKNVLEAVPLMLHVGRVVDALSLSWRFACTLEESGAIDSLVRFISSLGLSSLRMTVNELSLEDQKTFEILAFRCQALLVHGLTYTLEPKRAIQELESLQLLEVPDDGFCQNSSRVLPLNLLQAIPASRAEMMRVLNDFLAQADKFESDSLMCQLAVAEISMYALDPRMREFYDRWRSNPVAYTDDLPVRGIRVLMTEGRPDLALAEAEWLLKYYQEQLVSEPQYQAVFDNCLGMVLEDQAIVYSLLNRSIDALRAATESISKFSNDSPTYLITAKTTYIECCVFHHRYLEASEAFDVVEHYASSLGLSKHIGMLPALRAFVAFRLGNSTAEQAILLLKLVPINTASDKLIAHFLLGLLHFELGDNAQTQNFLQYPSEYYNPLYRLPALVILESIAPSADESIKLWIRQFPTKLQQLSFYIGAVVQPRERLHLLTISVAGYHSGWSANLDGLSLSYAKGAPYWLLVYIHVYKKVSIGDLVELVYGEDLDDDPKKLSRKLEQHLSAVNKPSLELINKYAIQREGNYFFEGFPIETDFSKLDYLDLETLLKVIPAFQGETLETEGQKLLSKVLNLKLFTAITNSLYAGNVDDAVALRCYERLIELQFLGHFDVDDETEFVKKKVRLLCRTGNLAQAQEAVILWSDAVERYAMTPIDSDFLVKHGLY
jgi:hypothetical protein